MSNDKMAGQACLMREALEYCVRKVPALATVPGVAAALAAPQPKNVDPVNTSAERVEETPKREHECRHCGFLCRPNPAESRKWYPLEQANHPVIPESSTEQQEARDLTDAELAEVYWGSAKNHMDALRAVIAADRARRK